MSEGSPWVAQTYWGKVGVRPTPDFVVLGCSSVGSWLSLGGLVTVCIPDAKSQQRGTKISQHGLMLWTSSEVVHPLTGTIYLNTHRGNVPPLSALLWSVSCCVKSWPENVWVKGILRTAVVSNNSRICDCVDGLKWFRIYRCVFKTGYLHTGWGRAFKYHQMSLKLQGPTDYIISSAHCEKHCQTLMRSGKNK